ncbi:hypothetical protein Pmar_PMAR029668 [Perkinsus marinus ATCC 50983]|uniref:Uncharacterized protein n=1 Tax=Perkinsus marinus (strain ATCC 50983 / TXsc) TaxID=423536 RepID=C5KFN4_PERM5|nr:hypothetical protein Pmar_PMAR029668 [Perkinsus marinus ATCC 50983]EER16711.1 hypothetical protein Pmar_PMAR029668 [Perkinsus marinus ATCC 50983]|eukprot:XP_002784915.1 hypothetical protein Pmar_PMAR029668 [Perkinsus marinus ATCC 50983]
MGKVEEPVRIVPGPLRSQSIRSKAKMNLRLTMCIFCVIDYVIVTRGDFPSDECRRGFDCFSSPLNFDTIFTRDMDPVDCDREEDFNSGGGQIIVNCMKFVDPNAANWLMHLAISHSLWLLFAKAFEIIVWMASGNKAMTTFMLVLLLLYTIAAIALFFAGLLLEFTSSWIGFVVTLSFPAFVAICRQTALALRELRRAEIARLRTSVGADFGSAVEAWTAAAAQDGSHALQREIIMDDTLEQGAEGMRKRVNNAMQRIYSQDTYGLTLDIGAVNVEVPPQQSKFTTQRVDGRKNDVYSINGNTTPHLE